MRYEHTQRGTVMIAVLLLAMAVLTAAALQVFHWVPLLVVAALGLCLCMFHSLTVTVDDEAVRVRFAGEFIRFRFPLGEIESCKQVRNRWWFGWGIKWYYRGWLYNVSGLDAVELKMKDGRLRRIGTDEPEKLAAAINAALADLRGESL